MSLRASLWALDDAPVADSVGALILLALADEANDDGTDACPYKDKLIKRARKSERTVQTYLRKLYQDRLIEFGDQAVAMRRYGKQPGHAPRAWNLNLNATWANRPEPRTEEEMKMYSRFMATGRVDSDEPGGVQNLPPTADQGKHDLGGVQNLPPTADRPGGVQNLPPTADQGKHGHRPEGGVQTVAPFPIGSKTKRKTSRFGPGDIAPVPLVHENLKNISLLTKNQEEALALVDDVNFFPAVTAWEQELLNECDLAAGERWTVRGLRKVITTPLIRELSARDPDLVRRAFLSAAHDPETVSPRRMLYLDLCPHWSTAAVISSEPAEAAERPSAVPAQRDVPSVPPLPRLAPPTSPPAVAAALFAELGVRSGAARTSVETR